MEPEKAMIIHFMPIINNFPFYKSCCEGEKHNERTGQRGIEKIAPKNFGVEKKKIECQKAHEIEIGDPRIIETFIRQASVAMQRRQAERGTAYD